MKKYYPHQSNQLHLFCADIASIPLPDSSVDLVVSNHALEPNREQQDILLDELLRVAKNRLMLFEPCYQINSDKGKARMDLLGYIKDLDSSILNAGAVLVDKIAIQNVANPLAKPNCLLDH